MIPIKSWCSSPEKKALEQANNLAQLPFAFHHVALMPDTHMGYGMPIGGVVACKNVVSPAMVGVDIGCGMLAVQTSLTSIDTEILKKIMSNIRSLIPVGFDHHKKAQDKGLMPSRHDFLCGDFFDLDFICVQEYERALYQLGTLGGGNHFIEIQKGDDGFIWFMIHSGSRNLGKKIADHYCKLAKNLNKLWFSAVSLKHDLGFLPVDTEECDAYLKEMNYALEFAFANRKLMADRIMEAFTNHIDLSFSNLINIHHNYVAIENHYSKNVWVHRKGATSARKGELGIIPGSQGTHSYIVKGLGNPESFMSCSHGAGRKMGRKQAIENLDLDREKRILDEKGIIHSIRNKSDLDEAASAYKDIDVVMDEQKDLVSILTKLEPLAVIKG